MTSILISIFFAGFVRAEVLPGEELYLHCVSPQWQVDVLKTPAPENDQWRMEVSRNTVRGWELLENATPVVRPLDPDWVPSPTVFQTDTYSLVVQIQTVPVRGPQRQGKFYYVKSDEWIQNLMCRLPWLDEEQTQEAN